MVERIWLALGGASACAQRARARALRGRFLRRSTKKTASACAAGRSISNALMDRLYAEDPAQPGAVSLMTIHGAKGLEFDHVFVVGVGLRGRGDDPRLLNWLEIAARTGRRSPADGAHPRARRGRRAREDDAINPYHRACCIANGRARNARARRMSR